jgi:hypothetical protein
MNDKLITILPSDIISESMIKINQNFEFIASKGEITDQKLLYYVNGISDRLKNIETQNSQRDANLMNGLNTLDSKIEGLSSSIDIQDAIDKALANANIDVEQFIMDHLEDTLNHKLGDYVTTSVYQPAINRLTGDVSDLQNNLTNTNDEVAKISSAFDDWKANAVTGTASASRIVANSTFYKTSEGYLVDKNGNRTDYKTLESWYEGGCEINGVPQINEIDPERKGLDDDTICSEVISAAKSYFKTVVEQLSEITQWVDDNSAGVDIVASVKGALQEGGEDAHDITAAIFLEASKEGSTIKLGADRLDFSGNKRINFETGMFTITSNNFNIDAAGNVSSNSMTAYNMESHDMTAIDMTVENMTATNVTANGITATDITLKSKNGVTKIDESGVLWAYGAHIEGDVEAKRFLASDSVNIDTADYSGTITKNTTITGSTFGMVADGTLTSKNGGSPISVTGNSLYIELVDAVDNSNLEIPGLSDTTLYGVPTLCMKYIDQSGTPHIYRLRPGSWIGEGSSDSSDFRWYNKYGENVLNYSFNANAINTYSNKVFHNTLSANFPGELYLLKPENSSYFINNSGVDQIYRLWVNHFDQEDASTQLDYLKDSGLVSDPSSVTTSNVNEHTVYALRSKINQYGGSTYCDQSSSSTNITADICNNEFRKYLQSTISAGVTYSYSNIFTSLTTDYGVNNLYNFILYATGGSKSGPSIEGGNDCGWKIDSSVLSLNSVDAEIQGSEKLVNNLPFTTGGYYTTNTSNNNTIQNQEFKLNISAHPIINITNSGKTVATTTNLVYVNCSVTVSGRYAVSTNPPNSESIYPIQFHTRNLYNGIGGQDFGGAFFPQFITINLNFDCVFKLSSGMPFDPLSSTTKDTILNKVYAFMSSYPFKSDQADYTYNNHTLTGYARNHVQYSATLDGTVKVSKGDGTGGYTTGSATLTKTSIT